MAVQYMLRQARREDLPGMLQLSVDQGWNKVLENLQIMFDMFPEGSIVAENTDGEIISTCMSVPLDDSNGQVAVYVTKKLFRSKGIGRKVFDLSFKALGNRNVAVNAEWDKVEMYASDYFKIATLTFLACEFPVMHIIKSIEAKSSCRIVDIKEVAVDRILDYDRKIHPMACQRVLKWALQFATVGRVAFDGDEIKGWGLLQRSQRGYRLMPLYADTLEVATHLVINLLHQVQDYHDAKIQVFFPEDNKLAEKLYSEVFISGQSKLGKFKRMFTKRDIPIPSHFVYSVLSVDNVLA